MCQAHKIRWQRIPPLKKTTSFQWFLSSLDLDWSMCWWFHSLLTKICTLFSEWCSQTGPAREAEPTLWVELHLSLISGLQRNLHAEMLNLWYASGWMGFANVNFEDDPSSDLNGILFEALTTITVIVFHKIFVSYKICYGA